MRRPDFPLDIFPRRLQGSMKKIAEAYSVNVEPVAVAMMTILSAAAGNTTRVMPKQGWAEPVFLWSMIIGPSGSGKTPFVAKLLEWIHSKQAQAYEVYKTHLDEYEQKVMRVANKNAVLRRPQLLKHIVSDITIESLAMSMEVQPRGLLSYQDELSGWLLSHDQYRSKGADRQKYLELWNCNPWLKDRVSGSQFIRSTGCALLGGIQPLVMPRIFQEDAFIDGLLPRFLFTTLVEQPYSSASVTIADIHDWNTLLVRFYQMPLTFREDHSIQHRVIPFTKDAHEIFSRFVNESRAKKHGLMQVFIPKLISYTVRISGILHLLREGEKDEIDADVIKDSIKVTDYFVAQAKELLGHYGSSQHQRSESREPLVDALKASKGHVKGGRLSLKLVAQEFNLRLPKELQQSNQAVAYSIIELGLRTRIAAGHSFVIWDTDAIERLFNSTN